MPQTTALDPRWQAVLDRSPAADFVFAVRTTGIYCRPSCPARRPRPENVSFHANAAEAEAQGYRPCLRCHPTGIAPAQANADLVAAACRILDDADPVPTLPELARRIGLSPSHLHRQFRAATGLTPAGWARAARARRLRAGLGDGASVTQAMHQAGYGSSSRFYERADEVLGMAPRAYRDGGRGMVIRHALDRCSLGLVLVAQSERGICAIALGDDPQALVRDLQARFPQATLIAEDAALAAVLGQVVALIETPGAGLDLPLDLRGTGFQQRVWQALRGIRPGQTVSYAELARRIGAPGSARAVAGACAANPVAVAVPCHRVLRGDGSLSGYRWGMTRKRALLDRESRD